MRPETGRGAVLVTGTSTGIGRATAEQLDRIGFRVFGTVRYARDAEALCVETSERITPILMDVTDQATIAWAQDQIGRAVGEAGLVGLVNSAGIVFNTPLEFMPIDELRALFEVNVFGLLAVTQAFLPYLRRAQGRVVNVSSMASLGVVPFHGAYAASKVSVNALTTALRLELMPFGVHAAVVICGSIQTPIWQKGARHSEQIMERYPPEAQIYGAALRQLHAFFEKLERQGAAPEAPARAIAHALTARRPKNTYFVGADARLLAIAQVLLHGRLRDWVTLRQIGLEGRPSSP